MKIRNGFVSNSSSSSFTLFLPKGTKIEDIYDILLKEMQVPETSWIHELAKKIVKEIVDSIEGEGEDVSNALDELQMDIDKYGLDGITWYANPAEELRKLKSFKEKEMILFMGSFCSDGGGISEFLCYSCPEIDTPNMYLKNNNEI